MTDATALHHYRQVLTHHRNVIEALAQAPTPLSVYERMIRRMTQDGANDPPGEALLKLPKSYPGRWREYQRTAQGEAAARGFRAALGEYLLAQADLLHADGLLSDEHQIMARSVHHWPDLATRAHYFGGITPVYSIRLLTAEHQLDCVGSLLLVQSAKVPLTDINQAEDVGKLLLFTPGEGLQPFDNLQQFAQADVAEALRPGLRVRDAVRLGGRTRLAMTFEEVKDDVFASLLSAWQQKQLDDYSYHLRHRDLSPLQGLDWVVGLTRAVDLRDAFDPHGFLARRTARLLAATEPAWLAAAPPQARQALLHHARRVARYALQFRHLVGQIPSLRAFAKAQVEGQLRRRLGRRIDIQRLFVSEARVLGVLPKLWKGVPWLIYSEVKHGRDITSLTDKALANIGALDVDYWLTAMIVDEHQREVPGLDPNLIRTVVRDADIGGSYPVYVRALIDNAPHLKFHGVFAQLQQASLALQRQRAAMGAPADPAWAAALLAGHLPRATLDAAFEAEIDALLAAADEASTSDRESNIHTAVLLCTTMMTVMASAISPALGLAINGLLSVSDIVGGVQALRRGDYEQAIDQMGGALANVVGTLWGARALIGPQHSGVVLFREGGEALHPLQVEAPPGTWPLAPMPNADVSLADHAADDDGVFHIDGRHYVRQIDSPTQVRQLEVDYSSEHDTYRAITPQAGGLRQPIVRDQHLAWRALAASQRVTIADPVIETRPQAEESLQGMDAPAASAADQPAQWLDPQVLAQAGLSEEDGRQFQEAAYLLDQQNFRLAEPPHLPPTAPPAALAHTDELFGLAPLQVKPATLATREVGLNRKYLRSKESDFYHVPTERMMSHARTLQAAIDGHYGGTINGHVLRKHMNTFVSELLADLGYLRQGSFHINTVPVLVYSHPQTQAFYIVLTRAMYQNVAGKLVIQNNLVGKLTTPWESALANLPARDAFHLLPKLQQAEAQGRLFSVIAAFDLGETLARTRIFLIKAHFSLPGA